MKLYLGEIEAYREKKQIFLCVDEKRKSGIKNTEIFLEMKDIDANWSKNLLKFASKGENSIFYLDKENQYYMQLYLFFSLRRRLYYADIKKLSDMKYEMKDLLCQKQVQRYLWKQLCAFMKKNGYCFKIIKSEPLLYEERPFIPFDMYDKSGFLSISALRMSYQIIKRLMIRYGLYFSNRFNERFHAKSVRIKLSMEYANVKSIKSKSQSGCLFFSADDMSGDKLFIKIGTVYGADIKNEYEICQLLRENTNNKELYLLPYVEKSASDRLIFPFIEGCSLKDVIKKRDLIEEEIKELLLFLNRAVTDLSNCEIIHRDIHFDNILCSLDSKTGRINRFLLSDFGCAVKKDSMLLDSTIRQKRKNQYAGSIYRYSKYAWDDAASAAYVVMQNINANEIDEELENSLLSYIGKNTYVLR